MKTFKRFLDAGFNFQIKDSEVILREDEKIIFEIPFEEDNKIEDLIEENCNYHLKMISIKDPEYFEDADEFYLQNQWKDLILRIKHLVKGVEMKLGENVVEEFIELFQQKFPDISKVIDFEKNRYGDILSGEITKDYFILNKIKFWKKDGVTIKKFEDILSIFRSTCNFHEEGTDQFEMKTTGLTFIIGDFDDYLAVDFSTKNKTSYAEIWFRWWAPGVND